MAISPVLKEQIREIRQDLRKFFETHLQGYNKFYQIALIRYIDKKTTKKFTIPTAFSDVRGFDRIIYKENIVFKNQDANRRENIYIHFHPKTKYSKLIWLDDVKLDTAQNSPFWDYLTLIETHQKNFQAFIKLDKWLDIPNLQLLKSYLVKELKADPAAQGYIQPMRLPYLWNWKYNPPFLITVYKESLKELNTQSILRLIKSSNKALSQGDNKLYSLLENNSLETTLKSQNWTQLREQIRQLFLDKEYRFDESVVDFYLVKYLYKHHFSAETIYKILTLAREDIDTKKEGHIPDYIERTTLKAIISVVDENTYKNLHKICRGQIGKAKIIDCVKQICQNWGITQPPAGCRPPTAKRKAPPKNKVTYQ